MIQNTIQRFNFFKLKYRCDMTHEKTHVNYFQPIYTCPQLLLMAASRTQEAADCVNLTH